MRVILSRSAINYLRKEAEYLKAKNPKCGGKVHTSHKGSPQKS